MAPDAVAFIRALGLEQVDLLGFSLGGFISQVILQEEPRLVRKVILAGTGPAGGVGIDKVTSITVRDVTKGALTFRHPEYYLFFTETSNGRRAAGEFLRRLKERSENRDRPVSIPSFITQLTAIRAWAHQSPDDLSRIRHPVLVANGDHDKMVPSTNSVDLVRRLPNAVLGVAEKHPLFPLDHAEHVVLDDHDLDRQPVRYGRGEFPNQHREPTVANKRDRLTTRVGDLCGDGVRQPRRHGCEIVRTR
jgi:pimeloyl-ACP methyl ester carboxylesterase